MNAREAWDNAAEAWDEFVESGHDYYRTEVHGPALLEACGPVAGLKVLDLGCGQGWFSRRLAERGADVVGVELSENQLANARRHEAQAPLGIDYRHGDAMHVDKLVPAASFDIVTACMSIQDMDDPAVALRAASTVLKAGGRLLFSVPHPFTDTAYREWERDEHRNKLSLKVDRYFEPGRRNMPWRHRLRYDFDTPQWRLMLADWTRMIADAGFVIRRLHEPRPTEVQVERVPNLEDCYRLPYFLLFDCLRPDQAAG